MLHTASSRLARVANALNVRLTRFAFPCTGKRQRMVGAAQVANYVQVFAQYAHHSRLKSKADVSGKSANLYGATTYTQFATLAAVGDLARRAGMWVHEAGEALIRSAGNAREQVRYRVKRKTRWGPSDKHKS